MHSPFLSSKVIIDLGIYNPSPQNQGDETRDNHIQPATGHDMTPDIRNHVGEQIRIDFEGRDVALGRDRAARASKFAQAGTFNSSRCCIYIMELYSAELRIRAETALRYFLRAAADYRVVLDDQLSGEATEFLLNSIDSQAEALWTQAIAKPPFRDSYVAELGLEQNFNGELARADKNSP
jgi:hypothetical protein